MNQPSTASPGHVVITGAGTGIGEACARRFAAQGARIALVGRRR
ncbi:MAG TPA: SDR family NAD(P)-dependent oxidoreductase, partial [Paraburkholderia sp.]